MNHLQDIDYSDEILYIYSCILKMKRLGEEEFKYFHCVVRYFYHMDELSNVFRVLCCFLSNGESYLRGNEEKLDLMVDISIRCISRIKDNVIEYNNTVMGFLLLQIIVNQYGDVFKMYDVIKGGCEYYLQHDDLIVTKSTLNRNVRILKSKIINLWALSSVHSRLFDLK
jgi:hypothetical protein